MSSPLAASLVFMGIFAANGQQPGLAETPAFEVASVKAIEFPADRRESIKATPGTLVLRNVTLSSCIKYAFQVQDFRFSGPKWLTDVRYDIDGKAPDAVSVDRLRVMLRNLLGTRFHLAYHTESREMPVYALTVAKGGAKIRKSDSEGPVETKPGNGGAMNIELLHVSMRELADFLSGSPLERVVDETGLPGKYDLALNITPYLGSDAQGKAPGPVGISDMANILATAIQDQLGLKLESKKSPVEVLVVDRIDKNPAGN